ncbi:MAG: hypothetical protein KUG75_01420 [Pseudomonadales bacterium]|nr:hypothetical protein [Pseudomonadales bacterium]
MAKGRSFYINLYHGVSIKPGKSCACSAVKALSEVRFLSADAPMLPVDSCNLRSECKCTYKHHKDRRSEVRRDSDIGLPLRMGYRLQSEKRMGLGRRVTDAA